MEGKECGECYFWEPIDGHANLGHCRRFPPQSVEEESLENQNGKIKIMRGSWPVTEQPAWCGEFKQTDKPFKSVYEDRGFRTVG